MEYLGETSREVFCFVGIFCHMMYLILLFFLVLFVFNYFVGLGMKKTYPIVVQANKHYDIEMLHG